MAKPDQPLLSRTGTHSPIGTLIAEVKTKVDPDTEAAFRRICAEAGTDAAGALRNYVCKVVHGKTYDQMVVEASQRRRLALGLEGPDGGLIGSVAAG
jgi:hypothetical protein